MRPLPFVLLLAATSAHADWTTGQDIWPAIYIDVTDEGLAETEALVAAVLPPTFPIELPSQQGTAIDIGLFGIEYFIGLQNFYVVPEIQQADILPTDDKLDIIFELDVSLSAPGDPAVVEIDVDADVLFDLIQIDDAISEDCEIYTTRPIPVTATTSLGLAVEKDRFDNVVFDQDGNISLDAELGDIVLDIGLTPGTLAIENCVVGDIVEFVLDVGFGSVEEFLLAELEPVIDEEVAAAVADLEPQIEDAFDALVLEDTLDLLGSPLNYRVFPRDFFISPEGIRLEMAGAFDPGETPHPCIAPYDKGLSLQTIPPVDPRYPALSDQHISGGQHLGIMLNDDWGNQALYALWYGGLLCQTISNDNSAFELPIPLDTNLLSLLAAQQFDPLFPETTDMIFATRPEAPPILRTTGPNTANIEVNRLGLDMYAELDGRMSRMAVFDLSADAGVDVTFDGTTGEAGAAILFAPEDIGATVVFNDLVPEASTQMESGFSVIAQQLVAPLLGDALDQDLAFALPSFAGLGIDAGDVTAVGPISDFIGVFGTLGPVTYGADTTGEGCDLFGEGGSTDGGGCDLGCSSGRVPVRMAWLALPLLFAWRRRRTPV